MKNRQFIRETSVLIQFVAGFASERYAQSLQATTTAMLIAASKIAPHIMPRRSKSSFVESANLVGGTIDDSSRGDRLILPREPMSGVMVGLFLFGTIYFAEMKRSLRIN
jgi:hypothetical protein